ncbi:MAG: DNA adenine methylase, partial [Pleurocapsa sp. SU_196_0]|nr:DNA adenine methylase [Pleurocapsa sp. SU_196_0]
RRFTDSSIERVAQLPALLRDVRITNLDYREVVQATGEDTFVFLDPPYLSATKSKLYGKSGDLHTGFEHASFAEVLRSSGHQWLVTYDDCDEIRRNFAFARLEAWELQYGMNNYKQASAAKGQELFIRNYAPPTSRGLDVPLF